MLLDCDHEVHQIHWLPLSRALGGIPYKRDAYLKNSRVKILLQQTRKTATSRHFLSEALISILCHMNPHGFTGFLDIDIIRCLVCLVPKVRGRLIFL